MLTPTGAHPRLYSRPWSLRDCYVSLQKTGLSLRYDDLYVLNYGDVNHLFLGGPTSDSTQPVLTQDTTSPLALVGGGCGWGTSKCTAAVFDSNGDGLKDVYITDFTTADNMHFVSTPCVAGYRHPSSWPSNFCVSCPGLTCMCKFKTGCT